MKKIAFFDAKPYDRTWFDYYKEQFGFEIKYFENKFSKDTAFMAHGFEAIVVFVNDEVDKEAIDILVENNVKVIALRSAGYNNVDIKAAFNKVHVVRVPAYSPYAVAEHAIALLLALNRQIHRAYNRTRDGNFSLTGLTGFDLHGKTVGVIGTGKIGQVFIDICHGFGMNVIAFDPFPAQGLDIHYVTLDELIKKSDMISLHCPLTKDTHHMIDPEKLSKMKDGVYIINTSRGGLIDSKALLNAIKTQKIGAAGLDVYEEESDLFYEDFSNTILQDDILARLISLPNVIVTSHQAFLTEDALCNIAKTTLENFAAYFNNDPLINEICYQCNKSGSCNKKHEKRCF
ncbi:MAG: 2-hydroxyacid dehydrogenase [Clostridiales bacterium]|nr:2-hydroxyacid dehydrogenase [Clostridiales bacterium]